MNQLKVKSTTNAKSVAGVIAKLFKEGETSVEVITVGAAALNQVVKAVAIARGYLAPVGVDIVIVPSFTEVKIDDASKTAITTTIVKR